MNIRLSLKETLEILKISREELRVYVAQGQLSFLKTDDGIRFLWEDVERIRKLRQKDQPGISRSGVSSGRHPKITEAPTKPSNRQLRISREDETSLDRELGEAAARGETPSASDRASSEVLPHSEPAFNHTRFSTVTPEPETLPKGKKDNDISSTPLFSPAETEQLLSEEEDEATGTESSMDLIFTFDQVVSAEGDDDADPVVDAKDLEDWKLPPSSGEMPEKKQEKKSP